MKRFLARIVALCCVFAGLTGCTVSETTLPPQTEDSQVQRILFVTDDVNVDTSLRAWELLQQEASQHNTQVTLMEVQSQKDKTSAALNQASEGLYEIIILDRLADEAAVEWVGRNAGYYPDVQYLCLDVAPGQKNSFSNVTYAVLDDTGLYYLYGTIAAMNSVQGELAFLGGENGARSEIDFLAFYKGAVAYQPEISVRYYPLGQLPTDAQITIAVEDALYQGVDAFCAQTQPVAVRTGEMLRGRNSKAVLLVGEAEPAKLTFGGNVQLLACFNFKNTWILSRLFLQCCEDRLVGGIRDFDWTNNSVLFQRGLRYPGNLEEDELEECQRVEQDVKSGLLMALTEKELQEEEINRQMEQFVSSTS